MRQIQRALCVLAYAEMEGLDACGAVVDARVAGRKELSATETSLAVEDGRVADGHFYGNSLNVELLPGWYLSHA